MNKRILVIEDSRTHAEMIEAAVSQYGTVVCVRAVDEAIGAFMEESRFFDLVIMDLQIIGQGLTPEQQTQYLGLEAFAFINEYYLAALKNEEERREIAKTIIVISRCAFELKERFPEQTKEFTTINAESGFIKNLCREVKRILNI